MHWRTPLRAVGVGCVVYRGTSIEYEYGGLLKRVQCGTARLLGNAPRGQMIEVSGWQPIATRRESGGRRCGGCGGDRNRRTVQGIPSRGGRARRRSGSSDIVCSVAVEKGVASALEGIGGQRDAALTRTERRQTNGQSTAGEGDRESGDEMASGWCGRRLVGSSVTSTAATVQQRDTGGGRCRPRVVGGGGRRHTATGQRTHRESAQQRA
mmetsp:Transcript_7939/g.24544  ORF Transcript_7939/g.24544 Transcript_7939/m.24544 type:complete len:210 (+) Transcript_7939:1268-1897(+)